MLAAVDDMLAGHHRSTAACARHWRIPPRTFSQRYNALLDGEDRNGGGAELILSAEDELVLAVWVRWHAEAWVPQDALTVRQKAAQLANARAEGQGSGFAGAAVLQGLPSRRW